MMMVGGGRGVSQESGATLVCCELLRCCVAGRMVRGEVRCLLVMGEKESQGGQCKYPLTEPDGVDKLS